MDASGSGVVDRLRQPEYTGENRCTPCTAVNVTIGVALGAAVAVAVDPVVGAAATGLSLAAIWLRGYLVPGTPELTKRYLPGSVLRLFGKAPPAAGVESGASAAIGTPTDEADPSGESAEGVAVDPQSYLLAADALVETDDGSDLTYAPWFASAWRSELETARETADGPAVARLADVPPDDEPRLSVEERGNAVVAAVDGERVGHWVSRPAFLADAAADRVLRASDDEWTDLPQAARSGVLGGLRLFVEECPACGAEVTLSEEVVASCCTARDVVVGRCDGCEARVFELEPAALDGVE
ncbi:MULTISPECIES: hypothetical protein [unclassified Halorubrum]|uniref:hypothetical protein n=1 Tax=unclassified Halorubrum TaxID=2642239 RepID=UPI0010FA40FE|nr:MULTISPECIES: hypothetical protein [unclassified Halorubrum]TKX42154.1 hypothetical protein EXE50_15505 [Halorubrum sp. ARQ200]TKX49345.1 hypothetical protein EXE49_12490 [Halorubrum sp. ASP121]